MLYRKLGDTGVDVSILGFGCMRLPVIDGKIGRIDEIQATKMLHYAIDNGVNYVDTAYPYHSPAFPGPGESEPFVGRALCGGYRDRVNLATKLPSWMIDSGRDMERLLDEQLARLKTDRIDFYLVHALNRNYFPKLADLGVFEFLDRAVKSGKIRFAGFSFHDEFPLFKRIIDSYNWSFCQIQMNYMDLEYQAGRAGMDYAARKGVGVVVMEPLRGGSLTSNLPADVAYAFNVFGIKRSPAEWAFRYVWDLPQVGTALSGMSELGHVIENVRYANDGLANSLSAPERDLIDKVRRSFRAGIKVGCTACQYCMPCPDGVNIPGCFTQYNNAYIFGDVARAKATYNMMYQAAERASRCTRCGLCVKRCPQRIAVIEKLADVAALFESDAARN